MKQVLVKTKIIKPISSITTFECIGCNTIENNPDMYYGCMKCRGIIFQTKHKMGI